jgi:outer membrane protein OmpA-like peptidoglycan-associated protein
MNASHDTEPPSRRGRPGLALTLGLPILAALAMGYWGVPRLSRAISSLRGVAAPVAEPAPSPKAVVAADHGPVTLRVAGDPWSGYSTFRGEPRFLGALAKYGITLRYLDDPKYYDQNERMRALATGEIDVAVTTLDAFLQNGANHLVKAEYPGVVLFGIDESAGGDAVFLEPGKTSFDTVKATDRVCYSTATPSEHLWDFASLSFDRLGDLPTDNGVVAKDCWEKLKNKQVQVGVLWQPYTAIAERAGYTKVFATGGQADDVILDVFVAGRQTLAKHRQALIELTSAYFKTIDGYVRDTTEHAAFILRDCGADCGGDPSLGDAVISGIDFLTFEENLCLWFGHCGAPSKILPRVGKTGRLLIAKNKLRAEQLPAAESIIDDTVLVALKEERLNAARLAAEVSGPNTLANLPVFSAQEATYTYAVPGAERAPNIGTLRLPNILFRDGGYALDKKARATVADIAEQLKSFPALCVRITGHTSSSGNPITNRQLSQFRAVSIATELNQIDPRAFPMSRFQLRGLASSAPVLAAGVEDAGASRRTEFGVFNCATGP